MNGSAWYWADCMTLPFDRTHDFDLGVSRSESENALSQEWGGRLIKNEKDVSHSFMPMILTCVYMVRWADVPDSDRGDFRRRRAVDISSFIVVVVLDRAIENVAWTHWGHDKMDALPQTKFSSAISWLKMCEFWLKCQWSLFLRVQLTIFQHWFRLWLGAVQQMESLLTHIGVTRPQWIKTPLYSVCSGHSCSWVDHNTHDEVVFDWSYCLVDRINLLFFF